MCLREWYRAVLTVFAVAAVLSGCGGGGAARAPSGGSSGVTSGLLDSASERTTRAPSSETRTR